MNDVIATLPTVDLAQLGEQAGLLQRVDRKYLLPRADLDELLGSLPPGTRVLEIDGRRRFGYRSLYFDTADLLSYRLTALRRRRRFKLRTRSYLDSGEHLLEIKTRGPRGLTIKQRIPYAGNGLVLSEPEEAQARAMLECAGATVPRGSERLVPVLSTDYHRSTLLLGSDSRVTVDTGLHWSLAADGLRQPLGAYAVVETKTPGRPSAMDHALWGRRHRPCSFSKFGTGLAVRRPELPAHRWRPTMNRFLNTQELAS